MSQLSPTLQRILDVCREDNISAEAFFRAASENKDLLVKLLEDERLEARRDEYRARHLRHEIEFRELNRIAEELYPDAPRLASLPERRIWGYAMVTKDGVPTLNRHHQKDPYTRLKVHSQRYYSNDVTYLVPLSYDFENERIPIPERKEK